MSKPFKINVRDEDLIRLKQRLELTSLPTQLQGPDHWAFGAPVDHIKRLIDHWLTDFDWQKAEAKLNELPQYMVPIKLDDFGTIDIHYVYQKSEVKNAIPLLFVHGWPGSFVEVQKLLPLLKGGKDAPAFHIIAPSLPNFGFSEGVVDGAFHLEAYAETCHKLMLSLGYNKYVTQAGDWGFFITRAMGILYPDSVLVNHINMVRAFPPSFTNSPMVALQHAMFPYSEVEQEGLKRQQWMLKEGFGYRDIQQTRPQTIGFALQDSPVALLAWIYEKLHDWTDSYPWTDDEILTWISIYYFSRAGPAASVRIYYTCLGSHTPEGKLNRDVVSQYVPNVKLAVAHFPKEILPVPRVWAHTMGPIVHENEPRKGGHFAAWENPEAIAGDLNAMFKKDGPCFNIVDGKSGFDT